jgi:hypothetical protein
MAVGEYVSGALESTKKFWHDLDIKKWSEQIGGSSAEAIEAAVYFCLSFAVGFLFKKYFKFIFICLIVSLFIIKGMEYSNFLVVNWDAIKTFFGMTGPTDFNAVVDHFFDWIKNHLLLFIAATVGFLVGYKLG